MTITINTKNMKSTSCKKVSCDLTKTLIRTGLCLDTTLLIENFVIRERLTECDLEYFNKLSKFIERRMVANNKLRGYWGEDRFVVYDLDPVHEEELCKNETEWGNILDDIYVNSGKSVNSYYRVMYHEEIIN